MGANAKPLEARERVAELAAWIICCHPRLRALLVQVCLHSAGPWESGVMQLAECLVVVVVAIMEAAVARGAAAQAGAVLLIPLNQPM